MDNDNKCDKCDSVLGVTRTFKDLVERYSPDSTNKMRSTIYKLRSDLSHGTMLFQLDESPWSFGSTFRAEESDASQWLVRITRDMMVNWLRKFAAMEDLTARLLTFGTMKRQNSERGGSEDFRSFQEYL